MKKYLRAKTNGIIFDWNERLAANPDVEEVAEEQAYPERFAPVDLAKREPVVDLSVKVETVAPPTISPELLAEASKPFDSPRAKRVTVPKTAAPSAAGLSFGDI